MSKWLVIRNTVSSFLKKLMLQLISTSGILTNVCLGTSRTLRLSSFFSFFVFLHYCTAVLLMFLSWTNKRIINPRATYMAALMSISVASTGHQLHCIARCACLLPSGRRCLQTEKSGMSRLSSTCWLLVTVPERVIHPSEEV